MLLKGITLDILVDLNTFPLLLFVSFAESIIALFWNFLHFKNPLYKKLIYLYIQYKSVTERQISHYITYMWGQKKDANELIYKTEIDPQT